jgi:hypothetical protein
MTKKLLRKSANFAPSLLSAVPNAVKIGAGVGGGIGLLQGAGIFESDAEKKATNVGNRLGKVLTSSTVGAGLGAGAGYGVNRYNLHKEGLERVATAKRKEAQILSDLEAYEKANPRGIRKAVQVVQNAGESVSKGLNSVKEEVQKNIAPTVPQRLEIKEQMQNAIPKPSIGETVSNKVSQDIETTKEAVGNVKNYIGGVLNRFTGKNNIKTSRNMKNISNFQDPATIQRLIQYGSTYIPQNNTGVVSLEATLRGKMQKKKLREPKVPASMGVKEINSMIESGKPTGKYFNKEIRKSANFLKRQQQAEFGIGDQINKGLVSAGKLITQPAAKAVRKAATKAGGGNLASVTGNRIVAGLPFGIADKVNYGAAKAAVGTHDALNSVAKVLDTDKAAKYAAIGVGGTTLAGGGLLAAKLAQKKQEDEARYSKTIRKSASFGIIPTGLINGAQKVARGAANRFGNLSPQINAANVGTAVGAGLGALEGSGINETEEQRRSTGLVGRAGKVLGMTGLGAGVGRGVGSVAGAGVNRYQANQRLQNRRKDNPDAFAKPVAKPRSINVKDEFEE